MAKDTERRTEWREIFFVPKCIHRGESKRERTRECLQFYAPLIER